MKINLDPSVSFIIAVKNKANTIERCLRSIQCNKAEAIVVDGKSVDGTTPLIDTFHVRHLFDNVAGPGSARNLGLKESNSDYVVILDGDQWVPVDFVKSLLRIVDDKEYDAVFCNEVWVGSSKWKNAFEQNWLEYSFLRPSWEYGGPRVYRRQFLVGLGGWDEGFFAFEDWDLWNRSLQRHPRVFRSDLTVFSDASQVSPRTELRRGIWYGSAMPRFLGRYHFEWKKLIGVAPLGWPTALAFSARILIRTKNFDSSLRAFALRFARSIGLLMGVLKGQLE